MQPAEPVPLSEHQREQLRQAGATDDLLAELGQSEMWLNNRYVATVQRREDGSVAELSIRRKDRKAARDWRDFQRIKTEVAGADVEAFELYPAEDRLMDTANQYYLWCLPPGQRIQAGYMGPRNVRDSHEAPATSQQRELPPDWVAADPRPEDR